jgi:hypothetical protein
MADLILTIPVSSETAVMAMCIALGMALAYVVWAICTGTGERPLPHRRRRSGFYY